MENSGSCDLSIVPYGGPLKPLQVQSVEDGHSSHTRPNCQSLLYSCRQFVPSLNSPKCNVCGCHRALHPKSACTLGFLSLTKNLERGSSSESPSQLVVVPTPNPNPPAVNHRPIRQSRVPSQPKVVKRKIRTKITRKQEDFMEVVINDIGWNPRKQNRRIADWLCKEMKISRTFYLQWIRDMKLLRDSEREEARMQAERAAEALLLLYNMESA